MLNEIVLMGRLTKDPEMRNTQSGKFVTTFTLAVDRDFDGDKTDFFTCVAWNKTAEFVKQYIEKGQLITVKGSMQSREWSDKNGNNRLSWDVQVTNVYPCERKKKPDIQAADFSDLDDEDIPF